MALSTEHKATPYVVIDFETGGLDLKTNALTEIACIAIKGDTLEEIDRYEALIAPYGYKYDQRAFEVTGLSLEKLQEEGKPIKDVMDDFIAFLQKANVHKSKTGYKPMIVAHNPLFEVNCLQHLFHVTGKTALMPNLLHGSFDFHGNYQPYYQDTITLAKLIWAANKRMKNYKLGDVCGMMGLEIVDAHRAMNDVKPTLEFLSNSIQLLRGGNGISASSDTGIKNSREGFHFQIPKA